MVRRPASIAAAAVLIGGSGGVSAPYRPLPDADSDAAAERRESGAGLPFARGQTFATLDEYLAFRESGGAIDLPWYKQVAPGIYELRTSMRPAPDGERITRADLSRKFGFDR